MGRSRTITNKQILEAARQVFLAEGFGASTIEIARRAGVSEGSIFKRFATKEDLFFAAMGEVNTPQWIRSLETLPGQGDIRENLVAISFRMLEFLHEAVPRVVILHSKGILPPDRPGLMNESPLVQNLKALTAFFEEEMKLGRIRTCDPEIPARLLLGALTNQILMEQMSVADSNSADHESVDHESADRDSEFTIAPAQVMGIVEMIWCGIAPVGAERL
jgi:AcrR family transcriptional regulator